MDFLLIFKHTKIILPIHKRVSEKLSLIFLYVNIIEYKNICKIKYKQWINECFSPVCAVDSGVDFAMDEDEEYNWIWNMNDSMLSSYCTWRRTTPTTLTTNMYGDNEYTCCNKYIMQVSRHNYLNCYSFENCYQ